MNITTRDGFTVCVDAEYYAAASAYKWVTQSGARTRYARVWINGKVALLHRLLMNAQPGEVVDHIDGDGLNNCRSNLRICSRSQNAGNTPSYAKRGGKGASGFKGVCGLDIGIRPRPWMAYITVEKKRKYLGYYATQEEAAKAYDCAAVSLFGEFAYTNFTGAA